MERGGVMINAGLVSPSGDAHAKLTFKFKDARLFALVRMTAGFSSQLSKNRLPIVFMDLK